MDYKSYEVRVYSDGNKAWYRNDKLHREDGPAIEYSEGRKYWYLDGVEYTEADFKKKIEELKRVKDSCDGKIVEVDGKKYKLVLEKA